MDRIKKFLKDYVNQPQFGKRVFIMMLGVVSLGFWLSFLIRVNFGTDPCSFMNLTISKKLSILFGTWQVIFNAVLFIIVIIFARNYIGLGTLANMVLIGYIADFCGWLWDRFIPASYFTDMVPRVIIFIIAFTMFVISASLYMNADMGLAPYDVMPILVNRHVLKKAPFAVVRILYDYTAVLIGVLCGGKPNIGIILMALFLGPVISAVGKYLNEKVFHI